MVKLVCVRTTIVFIVVILTAFFLRFYQLGNNPPSLTWDEVAWGYNAYSLGIDGRDEFGRFLPLDYLESFGDFKPPVYAYLTVIPVKLFGLNEFAVRFPSAFFGVLTVVVTYFLTKRIFHEKLKTQNSNVEIIALFSTLFLAISPWHINLSRAAFEANVATFFLVAGVWFFLVGAQSKRWYIVLSVVSFILSIYTFNTARIVAPLLILGLVFRFRNQLIERKKEIMITSIVGILLLLPTVRFLLSPQASLRFREVNIFSDISVIEKTNQQIANDGKTWWSKIIHNRRLAYGVEYIRHYLDNLNPQFLFIKGDGNPKFSTQDVGELYLWELPFLIIGILFLFKSREGEWWVVPYWLLVGIIPAATARETPHALRIETTLPMFQIFVAYGLIKVARKVSSIKYKLLNMQIKYLIFSLYFLFLIFNFLYYYHGYYAHYPREFSSEWQYGYKEAISYVKTVEDKYDTVYFTESLGRPYIYFLFYTLYDPKKFRIEAKIEREVYGFVHVRRFGKYIFAKDLAASAAFPANALYIDTVSRVPGNAKIEKTFKLLNGQSALIAYTI